MVVLNVSNAEIGFDLMATSLMGSDGHMERERERERERETDRQTDKHTDTQTERQIHVVV